MRELNKKSDQEEYEKKVWEKEELKRKKKDLERKISDDQKEVDKMISQLESWVRLAVYMKLLKDVDLAYLFGPTRQNF